LDVAFAVMTMPQVVIAQAIAIAALPTFAAQVARKQLSAMRHSLASTLRGVILLSLPATVGLIMLRGPVVGLLFERGQFDERSTTLVAWALLWYTAGLVSHSVVEIVSRAFYALHDTKTPVLIGSAAMAGNIGLSLLLAAWFERMGWMPHGGLALANTIATTLEMLALLWLMRKRLDGLEGRYLLKGTAKAAFGGGGLALGVGVWLWAASSLSVWVVALGGIAIGGVIYGVMILFLKVDEVRGAGNWLIGRLGIG